MATLIRHNKVRMQSIGLSIFPSVVLMMTFNWIYGYTFVCPFIYCKYKSQIQE